MNRFRNPVQIPLKGHTRQCLHYWQSPKGCLVGLPKEALYTVPSEIVSRNVVLAELPDIHVRNILKGKNNIRTRLSRVKNCWSRDQPAKVTGALSIFATAAPREPRNVLSIPRLLWVKVREVKYSDTKIHSRDLLGSWACIAERAFQGREVEVLEVN